MTEQTHFGYETIAVEQKNARVAAVFDSVAQRYDLMNDAMSIGLHRCWKDWFAWQCELKADDMVLDLAAGTGDISLRFAKQLRRLRQNSPRLIVSDINKSMLAIGRERLINNGFLDLLQFVQADAQQLPFANDSFDLITMVFGLRNVTDKQCALNEMQRVLKPQGRLMIMEFSKPKSSLFNKLYDSYSFNVLPKMGKLLANDEQSYQYLAQSIRMHPSQDELLAMFEKAGLILCEYQNLSGGIVAIHKGIKA